MFICSYCRKPSKPKTACTKVVTVTRPVIYPARQGVNRPIFELDERGKKRIKKGSTDDPGGQGIETAVEVMACQECSGTLGLAK